MFGKKWKELAESYRWEWEMKIHEARRTYVPLEEDLQEDEQALDRIAKNLAAQNFGENWAAKSREVVEFVLQKIADEISEHHRFGSQPLGLLSTHQLKAERVLNNRGEEVVLDQTRTVDFIPSRAMLEKLGVAEGTARALRYTDMLGLYGEFKDLLHGYFTLGVTEEKG